MPISQQDRRNEEQKHNTVAEEIDFARSLVGLQVTDASFSLEDGYMIEFDNRYRFRTCCAHGTFYRRRTH